MGKKCCELGECSTSYIYILLTNLLFFFKSSVLNLGELQFNTSVNIFGIETVIKNHVLIKLLLEYLGYIIYGLLFLKFLNKKKIFKKEEESKNQRKTTNFLIFQEENFNKHTFSPLLITCGTFALQLIVRNVLFFCGVWMFDLWIFNIIFISIFMKRIFKKVIYKHHLYTLIFNFIVNLILLITASCIRTNNEESDYDSIKRLYGSYLFVPLFYLVYLILASFICYSQVRQKQLMDFAYISPFKILMVIGIFSSAFAFIALIITSCVGCGGALVENNFCQISHPNFNDNTFYFDNFVVFLNNLGDKFNNDKVSFFLEIFLVYPLYSFSCFMKYFFETMVVYHLNPNYVLISDNIFYSTKKIITLINNPTEVKTYLKLLGELIAFFGYLICLEIFKFKCCGFSYNTRFSINKRGFNESIKVIFNEEEEDEDDDMCTVSNIDDNSSIGNEKKMIEMYEKNTSN